MQGDRQGPASDPFPRPFLFSQNALFGAHKQALKQQGSESKYPKVWLTKQGEETEYMSFPILVSGAPYTGGDTGRFRLLYKASDNTFYGIAVHMSSSDQSDMQVYTANRAGASTSKRDSTSPEDEASDPTRLSQVEGVGRSTSMRIKSRYSDS